MRIANRFPLVRQVKGRAHRPAVKGLALLCVSAGAMGVFSAPAFAGYAYGTSAPVAVGVAGTAPGDFSNPTGVAVNEVAPGEVGDVYVVDQGNNRVERFSATGVFLGEFNASGVLSAGEEGKAAPTGAFSAPTWIAVDNSKSPSDPSKGDVYVVDSGHNTIEKFSPTGGYLGQLPGPPVVGTVVAGFAEGQLEGIAVDPAGNPWVLNGKTFDRYDDSSTNAFVRGWETGFGSAGPGLGVDSSDHVYLNGGFQEHLQKYNGQSEGEHEGNISGECEEECTAGLAVNQATSELFVARSAAAVGPEIFLLNPTGSELQAPFATGGQLSSIGGLAVNQASGVLYVTDPVSNDLEIYTPQILATFTPGAASDEQPTSAEISATVNPNGPEALCKIEYGPTTSYGETAPCDPTILPASTPGTSTFQEIKAILPGLVASDTYHYRFTTTNSTGESHSEDQTFTLTPPPLVDQQPGFATGVTQFTATLNGSIDPYNLPTSYHFVYVATDGYRPGAGECPPGVACAYAQGSTIPSPDLYTPVNSLDEPVVPQTISGLQPGTTYHFALVATAPGGTVVGPDQTFTTPGIFLPEVATGAASGISVGAVTLSGAVNPMGWETTYQFQYGTSTAYGASWPTIGVQAGQFTGAQGVSIYLQNLQPSTTYHYRLLATNAAGTSYGADQVFRTPAYPALAIQEPTGGPPKVTPKPPVATKKALTNAQKLAAALKVCKKEAKKRQAKCVAAARKKYSPAKKKRAK